MPNKEVKRLENKINHKAGISQGMLAKTFDVSQSTIQLTIKI